MGGALKDARRRVASTVAGWHRRIVPRGRIQSPEARLAARPTPCSRPPHGPGAHGPRITQRGSRGRADTTGYSLVIK
ncbi:hypothetical protein DF147_20375 [Burkholderia cenocepacia]|nr:hypothetical protein DF147_20375 [Burkholderia cenocepacia]RQV12491.1 hypothetical protein DF132_35220 [Burkholderia cenocepacia]RQV20034.1 hypothetical protein DF039_13180 [Burkholderia cenocepacia]RQV56416.1 hypothetical protein DF018_34545 [Burkholderia cenocepacia]RQV88424.1 hypothetical protein DF019_18005 [Burkholderia cenocepacia]